MSKAERALYHQALLHQIGGLVKHQVYSEHKDGRKRSEIAALLRPCEQYFNTDDLTLNSRGGTDNTALACYQ
ncbi:hypothetical protein BGS_0878 [Beggiatoa sp. SS]|nr:hypothetical protein BGS_0878 [Beggiatoa sp. SS]